MRPDERLHEGCSKKWDAGEVALFAPGDDVVAECLEVAVGEDGDSKGCVPAAVLGDVAELLTVPNRVMVCWVCMVFLLLPGQSAHIPKGAKDSVTELALGDTK